MIYFAAILVIASSVGARFAKGWSRPLLEGLSLIGYGLVWFLFRDNPFLCVVAGICTVLSALMLILHLRAEHLRRCGQTTAGSEFEREGLVLSAIQATMRFYEKTKDQKDADRNIDVLAIQTHLASLWKRMKASREFDDSRFPALRAQLEPLLADPDRFLAEGKSRTELLMAAEEILAHS
jgi:hypothetical protein